MGPSLVLEVTSCSVSMPVFSSIRAFTSGHQDSAYQFLHILTQRLSARIWHSRDTPQVPSWWTKAFRYKVTIQKCVVACLIILVTQYQRLAAEKGVPRCPYIYIYIYIYIYGQLCLFILLINYLCLYYLMVWTCYHVGKPAVGSLLSYYSLWTLEVPFILPW